MEAPDLQFRLTKNDSADIAFALTCLTCGAVRIDEFREWLYHVIEHAEAPPNYIFDMLDVTALADFKPLAIMGWYPGGELSSDGEDALEGIGFLRGITTFEDRISKPEAIAKLRANKAFFDRMIAFFPFLDLEQPVARYPQKD